MNNNHSFLYQIVRSDGMIYGAPTSRYRKRGSSSLDRWHPHTGKFYTYRAAMSVLSSALSSAERDKCTVVGYLVKKVGSLDARTFLTVSKGPK